MAIPPWFFSLRTALAHVFTWVVIGLVKVLPEQAAYSFGRWLALLTWNCFPRWRRISLRNLELFYQHTLDSDRPSQQQLQDIARDAAAHFGWHTIEFIRMGQLPVEKALEMVVEESGVENYFAALKLGRGVIGLAMHYGGWAMGGCYLSQRINTVYAVNKKQRDNFFTRIAISWRGKFGLHNITTSDKVNSTILRALKGNFILELLADQNGGQHGIFAPFCGIAASTVQGPAALALKTGAPMLLTVCTRISPGRLRIVVKPPVDTSGLPIDKQAALVELMRRVNEAFEAAIREDPTQWLWGHKRWKTRPPGEPGLY